MANEELNKTVLVREALAELGREAPIQELADLIERRHGVKIDPKFVPILRASVWELEHLEKARQEAKVAVEKALAEMPAEAKKRPSSRPAPSASTS